eukprot:TRINITY_DN7855_c0_g1_i2.p1 TRINITY_DN7855_c0_g1~~TRINITY_DN7855_c0_g1_i2.p1  ORF type:complete len:435 (+),score=90.72 TRINITY_DN7855_c0_g1_i2:141-1445(+)
MCIRDRYMGHNQQTKINSMEELNQNEEQNYPQTDILGDMPITHSQALSDSKIKIEVCNPQMRKENLRTIIYYNVQGTDKNGSFDVIRCHEDFYVLREIMKIRWAGCYIPRIPPKEFMNTKIKIVKRRLLGLDAFVKKTAFKEHLYYSEEMQTFLREEGNVQKKLKSLPTVSDNQLMKKYHEIFPNLVQQSISQDDTKKIFNFKEFLSKIQKTLKGYLELCDGCSEQRKQFNEKFTTFITFCLPEYEKNVLAEVLSNEEITFITNTDNQDFKLLMEQIKELNETQSAFEGLKSFFQNEYDDAKGFLDSFAKIKSFEQAIQKVNKDKAEMENSLQKLLSGKSSVMFGKKEDKIAKLEINIEGAKQQLEDMVLVNEAMQKLLVFQEIEEFKCNKPGIYLSALNKLIQMEQEYVELMNQVWDFILKNPKIQEQIEYLN